MSAADYKERDPEWVRRSVREFLALPLLVVGAFTLVAGLSIGLDQSHASWLTGPRQVLGHIIGPGAASSALSAIATGLVTVTSITFSVLLLAVQQTAANLSPVVFSQFVSRRSNQAYLGFFVGLSVYSYLVLAAVQKDTPPTLGAAVALVFTIVALLILLTLVYSTLNQMRPVYVLFAIRTRALNARSEKLHLLEMTRPTPEFIGAPEAVSVSTHSGYVTALRLDAVPKILKQTPAAEIELVVTIGQYVAAGDPLALIRGAGEGAEQVVASVAHRLVQLGRQRELSLDVSASVGQLANIAWTSGSTAKHSPEVAAEAIDGLRDLLRRWSVEVPRASGTSGLPLVYRDDDCQNVVDAMLAMLAVARESQQQQTATRVLDAFARTLAGLQTPERQRIAGGLREAAAMIAEGAWTPTLRAAAAECAAALASLGLADAADALRSAFEQEHQSRHRLA